MLDMLSKPISADICQYLPMSANSRAHTLFFQNDNVQDIDKEYVMMMTQYLDFVKQSDIDPRCTKLDKVRQRTKEKVSKQS